MKYDVIATTLSFVSRLPSTRPFGIFNESLLRYGELPRRAVPYFKSKAFRRRLALLAIVYLVLGFWASKRLFPSWKYNKLRVVLLWPLLVLFRVLIGKVP
jgi:hypothetical protein